MYEWIQGIVIRTSLSFDFERGEEEEEEEEEDAYDTLYLC